MFATLGMAEFNDIEIAIFEHQWRNFAGPCTLISPVHVLRADLHGRICQNIFDFTN
ncbi:hypothetical protein D3C81_2234070 [compost metagenome]